MPPTLPRYAYLGPAGTFTEAALRQIASPDEATYLPQEDVVAALDAVADGSADFAVVAIENSVEGSVSAVLDTLAIGVPLVIMREMLVTVSFSVASRSAIPLTDVRRLAAHPHAWAQCRGWIRENMPNASHVPSASNTTPAREMASAGSDIGFDAALVPPAAVAAYGLTELAANAADNGSAVTRFVLIGHPGEVPAPTGADRTSLMVHLPDNEAGALLTMLEQFATRGVNLSRIESRPIGDELGRYSFSIDAEGHLSEPRMGEALMGLRRVCPVVRFLGSYPRADAAANDVRSNTNADAYADARGWLDQLRSGGAG